MDFSSLRSTLFRMLPTLLIALIMMGNALFCAVVVLPQWRAVDSLSKDLAAGQATITAQAAITPEDETSIIQSQLESVQQDRDTATTLLIADLQLDEILNDLYSFARDHQVTVSSLQAQQSVISPDGAPTDVPYNTRQFRVRVEGTTADLIAYITQLRETALKSFIIKNLTLTDANPRSSLNFDIQIYISPYASGEALASLDITVEALATVAPVIEASASLPATNLTDGSSTTQPAGTSAGTTVDAQGQNVVTDAVSTGSPIVSADFGTSPSAIMPQECTGAATPRFTVGEIVVVDFNDQGALRVLESANSAAHNTLIQIYDNEILHLLAGPVCGKWNETYIWYWYISVNNIQGWVGEGTPDDRWLCPLSNPECA